MTFRITLRSVCIVSILQGGAAFTQVSLALGDWTGTPAYPAERLELLDGTIRLRELIPTYEDPTLGNVVVSDADGVLHWRDAATLDCKWTMDGASPNHVYTAVGGASGTCPDEVENVGIGTASPAYKLHVVDNTPVSNATRGIHVEANSATTTNTAIFADAHADSGTESAGVVARAHNGTSNVTALSGTAYMDASETSTDIYGVRGNTSINSSATVTSAFGVHGQVSATSGTITHSRGVYGNAQGSATNSYGVEGIATNGSTYNFGGRFGASGTTAGTNFGVYGVASNATTANWAGWFQGDVMINGNGWLPSNVAIISDQNLKTNVKDIEDAGAIIAQLEPKTYSFLVNDHPGIALPSTPQSGLLAQEVEVVLPHLVHETTIPAVYDEAGNEVHPAEAVKGLDYVGLIPYLIGAVKEQQVLIAELQDQVTACCESRMMNGAGGSEGDDTGLNDLRNDNAADQRLTITPNPFSEGTVIGYILPKAGMVNLQVSDASGKSLFSLFEGQQMEGTQRYDWNTSFLAPGMYHVTLLVDGAPLVKKAVKVAR